MVRCGNRAEPLAGISEAQEQAHGCYMLSPCPRARSGPHPGLLFTRVWLACSRAWGLWRQAHRASSLSTTLPAPSSRAHAHQPWGSPCTEQNQRESDPRTAAAGSPTVSHKAPHPKKDAGLPGPDQVECLISSALLVALGYLQRGQGSRGVRGAAHSNAAAWHATMSQPSPPAR